MVTVYVLTKLSLDSNGDVISCNVGVTFSIHDAEAHKAKGIENDFETFQVASNWEEDVATSELVIVMRDFREMVKAMQDEALR